MPKIDARDPRLSAVVQYEDHLQYGRTRKVMSAVETVDTKYVIGTVVNTTGGVFGLGDTFGGVYIGSPAGENTQTIGTVAQDIVVIYREAGIGKKNLVVAADADLAALYTAMEAAGIQLFDQF